MMKQQQGLTLIELMISIALGLIVLLALTTVFANSSRSRMEMDKSNRQTENGRYAAQLLENNLRLAGYLSDFDPSVLTSPAAIPDICATSVSDLIDALPLHVQGIEGTSATPSCLSDRKTGTDIIAVRRTSTCVAGSSGCGLFETGVPHFQASLCSSETQLSYSVVTNADYATHYFSLGTTAGDFTGKHKNNCTSVADIYRYHVDIFYVANNNESGDGIPTLKRAEIGTSGFSIVPLVEGVQDLQIEYGLDTNNDGVPDSYKPNPSSVAEWRNVMEARVHLLVRNTEPSVGYADNRTYTLGVDNSGNAKTDGPFGDSFKRHVFETTVRFANPSWRRQ